MTVDRGDRRTYLLLVLVIGLLGFGTVMIYSASAALGEVRFASSHFFLKRWVVRLLIGLAAMYAVSRIDYRIWTRRSGYFLASGFLFLLVVVGMKIFDFGRVRGAYRWIPLPGGAFQPADLMRLALVIYLADSLSRKASVLRDLKKGFLPHVLVISSAMCLILLQPDLSTVVAISATCAVMLYLGGARFAHLAVSAGSLMVILTAVIFGLGYRKERVLAFLNPEGDTLGDGYQVAQSILALGSGGVTGAGLGQGLQKHFFLPEPHTDFVFSVVGEEFGMIGTFGVLLAFGLFGILGYKIARSSNHLEGFLLAAGSTSMILIYAFANIGVCTGFLPVTGLPLPFISYGGSSLLTTLIATGLLVSVGRGSLADNGTLRAAEGGRVLRTFRPAHRLAS